MANFLTSFLLFLEQPKKCGRQQTTTMSSLINKKIPVNDVSLPKPHPQVFSPPLKDLEQRIKLISSKLDEGNIKGGKKKPQISRDLVSKPNGSAGLLKSLTKLINLIGDGKIPEPLRPFFGSKLIALKKIDGGLRPIAIGNTLRRVASKCAGGNALSE